MESVIDFIGNDDDLIGILQPKQYTSYANQHPDNTHTIYREGNTFNGRATIRAR